MGYRIKDWEDFQHYKDRSPSWIKLYTRLLKDRQWFELPGESAKVLVMLWLVAADDPLMLGNLPDLSTIAFHLRLSPKDTQKHLNLLSHWLVQDDSDLIAQPEQTSILEKETEKRREEKEKEEIPEHDDIKFVVDDLNAKTGQRYRHTTEQYRKLIRSQFNKGFTVANFETVHTFKVAEWTGTEWEKHLCPDTLWGPKFEKYLNQARMKQNGKAQTTNKVGGVAPKPGEYDTLGTTRPTAKASLPSSSDRRPADNEVKDPFDA